MYVRDRISWHVTQHPHIGLAVQVLDEIMLAFGVSSSFSVEGVAFKAKRQGVYMVCLVCLWHFMAFNVANPIPNAIDRPFRDSLVRMPPIKMMTDGDESTTFNDFNVVRAASFVYSRTAEWIISELENVYIYIYINIIIYMVYSNVISDLWGCIAFNDWFQLTLLPVAVQGSNFDQFCRVVHIHTLVFMMVATQVVQKWVGINEKILLLELEVPSKLLTYLIYLYIFFAKSYDARKRVFYFLGFTARKALWKARQMALLHDWSLVILCGILQTLHLASKPSDVTRRFLTKGQLYVLQIPSVFNVLKGYWIVTIIYIYIFIYIIEYMCYIIDLFFYIMLLYCIWSCIRYSVILYCICLYTSITSSPRPVAHPQGRVWSRIGMWIVLNEKIHAMQMWNSVSRTALVDSEVDLWFSLFTPPMFIQFLFISRFSSPKCVWK